MISFNGESVAERNGTREAYIGNGALTVSANASPVCQVA